MWDNFQARLRLLTNHLEIDLWLVLRTPRIETAVVCTVRYTDRYYRRRLRLLSWFIACRVPIWHSLTNTVKHSRDTHPALDIWGEGLAALDDLPAAAPPPSKRGKGGDRGGPGASTGADPTTCGPTLEDDLANIVDEWWEEDQEDLLTMLREDYPDPPPSSPGSPPRQPSTPAAAPGTPRNEGGDTDKDSWDAGDTPPDSDYTETSSREPRTAMPPGIRRRFRRQSGRWGSFTFHYTERRPGQGRYTAQCPLHDDGCNKSRSWTQPSDRMGRIVFLKHWCAWASLFDNKDAHMDDDNFKDYDYANPLYTGVLGAFEAVTW